MKMAGILIEKQEKAMFTALTMEKKEIAAVYDAHFEGGICHRVGANGVTKIEPYDENGQMAYVPRVRVFRGDDIYCTLPVTNLCVEYCQAIPESK
jgi:hypothetical protein